MEKEDCDYEEWNAEKSLYCPDHLALICHSCQTKFHSGWEVHSLVSETEVEDVLYPIKTLICRMANEATRCRGNNRNTIEMELKM